MRPIVTKIGQYGFAKYQSQVVDLRYGLLTALNEQLDHTIRISTEDLHFLARGIVTRPNHEKTINVLCGTMAVISPIYAASYYFATTVALSSWNIYPRSLIGVIAGLMKWLFMCRTSFNLINKLIHALTFTAILCIADQRYLPLWFHTVLGVVSVFAGMTTALSSAGGLLKYLLPQLGFWADSDSLEGIMGALAVALMTNGPSKIYDVSEMLANMLEALGGYCSTKEVKIKRQWGTTKQQCILRLMQAIASLTPDQIMSRYTRFNPQSGLHEVNDEYSAFKQFLSTMSDEDYVQWLNNKICSMPEETHYSLDAVISLV